MRDKNNILNIFFENCLCQLFLCVLLLAILIIPKTSVAEQKEWLVLKGDISDQEMIQYHEKFTPLSKIQIDPFYRGVLWFKWTIPKSKIKQELPFIFFKSISDCDQTFWNGELIGATGVVEDNLYYLPHLPRLYRIPKKHVREENTLLIKTYKIGWYYDRAGPSTTPIISSEKPLKHKVLKTRFLRSYIYLTFGFILIILGLFFLWTHIFAKTEIKNVFIGLSIIFIGLHSIFYSFVPYEFFPFHSQILKIHCICLYLCLLTLFFSLAQKSILRKLLFFVTLGYCIGLFFTDNFNEVIKVYFTWYLALLFFGSILCYYVYKDIAQKGMSLISTALILTIVVSSVDVFLSILGLYHLEISSYVFMLFSIFVVTTLTRDFSNSYREIESEVKRRSQDLAQYAEKLILSDREKSRYLSHLMHDLRSPLTAIGSILRHQLPQSQDKELISQTAKRIDVLTQQIHDYQNLKITDSSVRKQKNVATIRTQETFSTLLLADLEKCLSEKKSKHLFLQDVQIEKNYDPSVVLSSTFMDSDSLARIFSNLLDNAFEALGELGKIQIHAKQKNMHSIEISIRDNGKGIDQEDLPKVLQEGFSKGKDKGTGFGLSSAKNILESFGGSLSIESKIHEGTCTTITLLSQKCSAPFAANIDLRKISKLVLIDDEKQNQQTWNSLISPHKELVYFDKLGEFTKSEFLKNPSHKNICFVFDHEFMYEPHLDVFSVIEKLQSQNIYLCSNHYQLPILQSKCLEHKVLLIAKPLLLYMKCIQS